MSTSLERLENARRNFSGERALIDHLVRFVDAFGRLADKSQRESTYAEFHNLAGRLPYWEDYDIGALILECAGDRSFDKEERSWLYRHALFRARWCAATATAGGEGRARMLHVNELQEKNA